MVAISRLSYYIILLTKLQNLEVHVLEVSIVGEIQVCKFTTLKYACQARNQ